MGNVSRIGILKYILAKENLDSGDPGDYKTVFH